MDGEKLSSKERRDRIIVEVKTKESNELKDKKSKEWPKVAIIILNWNGWEDTIECLESVFRISYPNYQVIVVDNGSTDGSTEKIKNWTNGKLEVLTPAPAHHLYHLSHPPVKKPIPYVYYTREEAEKGGNFTVEEKVTSPYPLIFIQADENLGFAGGNNIGIKYTLCNKNIDYLLLLNNDIVVDKNFLSSLFLINENDKKIGIVGPKIYSYEKYPEMYSAGCTTELNILKKKFVSQRGRGEIDRGQYNTIEEAGYIEGCCLKVNCNILNVTGLMDERYFLYFEDLDWVLRIKQLGWKSVYIPKSIVWHKGSSTMGQRNPSKTYYMTRNKLLLLQKIFKINFWVFLYPLLLGKAFITIFYLLFFKKKSNNKLVRVQALVNGHVDFVKRKFGIYK
ncbi:hypothetical protein ES705_24231 [subsurface metagenome]